MPLVTSGASLRRLPLFFAYCPDLSGALATRLDVRPRHLERWSKLREEGFGEFGCGYLPAPGTIAQPLPSTAAPTTPQMDGSLMIFRAKNLEKAWETIKTDVYYTEGVWDTSKCVVRQFIPSPAYGDA